MYHDIQPGESLTITCGECEREYKITFEPKAADMNFRERRSIPPAPFRYCPFCNNPEENFYIEELP